MIQEYIESKLSPRLQGDGGWVEFIAREGEDITLVFRGECSKCHMLDRCCRWMEEKIGTDLGEKVHIRPERRKPFFWDNA